MSSFKELMAPVQSYFIYPINLVMYIHLFLTSPEKVKLWCSDSDIMRQILSQYSTMIALKLKDKAIINSEFLIDALMDTLCQFALECLDQRKISLSEQEFRELAKRCCYQLDKFGALRLVDSKQITSIVLHSKTSPLDGNSICYQFFHKSIQDMMACAAVVPALRQERNKSFKNIVNERLGERDRDYKM